MNSFAIVKSREDMVYGRRSAEENNREQYILKKAFKRVLQERGLWPGACFNLRVNARPARMCELNMYISSALGCQVRLCKRPRDHSSTRGNNGKKCDACAKMKGGLYVGLEETSSEL